MIPQAVAAQAAAATQAAPAGQTTIGQPNGVAMAFFFVIIAITLGITYWAARRTRTTEHFYAATEGPRRVGVKREVRIEAKLILIVIELRGSRPPLKGKRQTTRVRVSRLKRHHMPRHLWDHQAFE